MSKHGRKMVVCKRCDKYKLHFGLDMCSACLRRTKRETKPSFYLGTCYSELSRRVKTFDPLRPNYYGKKKCTREEFINRFLSNKEFLDLYKNWQNNEFKRKFAPTIDRIKNNLNYTIDNLRFTSHYENSTKDKKIAIILKSKEEELYFDSQVAASKFFGMNPSYFSHLKTKKKTYKGYTIYAAT